MLIFAGSYERFLFGFQAADLPGASQESSAQDPAALERRYTFAAHQNAVKCVASGGHWLASGGCDDQIHLYDMKHGKDAGFLMNPGDGPVPCIQFFCPPSGTGGPSHMLSGSADGSIAVWQAGGRWEHLKLMKGHKSTVNALAVHPTGRVALSCSHDLTLRMWDMARGRCTYTAKLDVEADGLGFFPGGNSYALVAGSKVTVHSVGGEGGLLASLAHPRRALVALQPRDDVVMTGCEDGSIKVWDLRTSSLQQSVDRAHATRIRGLVAVSASVNDGGIPNMLASASSDGVVKLWDARMMGASAGAGAGASRRAPTCIAQAETRARITCLTTVDPKAPGAVPVPALKPAAAPAAEAADEVAVVRKAGKPKVAAGGSKQGQGKAVGRKPGAKAAQHKKRGGRGQDDDEIEIVPQEVDEVEVVPQSGKQQQQQQQSKAGKKQQAGSQPQAQQPAKKAKQGKAAAAPTKEQAAEPAQRQPKQPQPKQQTRQPKQQQKPAQSSPKPKGGKPAAGGLGVKQGGVQKKKAQPQQQRPAGKSAGGAPAAGGKKKFSMQLTKKAKGGK